MVEDKLLIYIEIHIFRCPDVPPILPVRRSPKDAPPTRARTASRAIRTPTTSSVNGQTRQATVHPLREPADHLRRHARQRHRGQTRRQGRLVGSAVVLRYDAQHDELVRTADECYVERGPTRSAFTSAGIRGGRTSCSASSRATPVRRQPSGRSSATSGTRATPTYTAATFSAEGDYYLVDRVGDTSRRHAENVST